MPIFHRSVSADWQKHVQQHDTLLEKIKKMKTEIIAHISKMDKPHFHWSKGHDE